MKRSCHSAIFAATIKSGRLEEAITSSGAESVKDMGKVMAVLKGQYAGQIDFGAAR